MDWKRCQFRREEKCHDLCTCMISNVLSGICKVFCIFLLYLELSNEDKASISSSELYEGGI